MQFGRAMRIAALVGCVASVAALFPSAVVPAAGQESVPICGSVGQVKRNPVPGENVNAQGWVSEQESLGSLEQVNYYTFSVTNPSTAQVYVGDQWYNLNLGLFRLQDRAEACWTVQARGASIESNRRDLQFVRPDERSLNIDPGDYILSVRAGDAGGFDPARAFTVRIAVTPRVCNFQPPDVPVEVTPGQQVAGIGTLQLTRKPDSLAERKFQVGISIEPANPTQFSLMSFNAYVSPPYTDLFDFEWELDGEKVAGVVEPTFLKPFAELKQTPDGTHTVKLTARGAREYKDPTEARFNFVPFDGGSASVSCTFP